MATIIINPKTQKKRAGTFSIAGGIAAGLAGTLMFIGGKTKSIKVYYAAGAAGLVMLMATGWFFGKSSGIKENIVDGYEETSDQREDLAEEFED